MFGHLHFQSLWAGVELNVFDELETHGAQTIAALGEKIGLAAQPAKMVVANLCALGLLEKQGDTYANGALTKRFLLSKSPASIVQVIRWQARIVYPGVEDYVRSLRENTNVGLARFPGSGRTLYERLAGDPELEKIFQDAMASMPSNRSLGDHLPLEGRSHLCDCGGGNGRNAIDLAGRHPGLRVTIFDQPTVCEKARANVASHGLGGRIDVFPGDFHRDPFPRGIDGILYCHIAAIWSKETNVAVFRRGHESLPAGGKFFLYNMVANDDQTGPLSVTCGSVYFHALATGEGFMHSGADYRAMLHEAGFARVDVVGGLPVSHALVIGTK
jgi:hypothetical protein